MTVTVVLSLILLVLMFWVGGFKGLGAFFSLILNLIMLLIITSMLSWGFNLYAAVGLGGVLILTVTTLSSGADEDTSMVAIVVSLIIMTLLIFVIVPVISWTGAYGFASEHAAMLESLSLTVPVSFLNLTIAGTLLATLGAISEASVAFAASMNLIYRDVKEPNFTHLYEASRDAGVSIVGTTVNTVLFGFFASFLSAALVFAKLHYGFAEIINSKLFVSMTTAMLLAILGVVLVLPITLIYFYYQRKESTQKTD